MFSLFGKKEKPQPPKPQGGIPPHLLTMRETLYSTSSLEPFVNRLKGDPRPVFPWSNFVEANRAIKQKDNAKAISLLKQIVAADGLETRLYLQAWHSLRGLGELPAEAAGEQIQGFIIENHMNQGLDIVAAFADHSARYWNFSGTGVVWDTRDPEIDKLIDNLLYVGQEIMKMIGLNQKENLPVPLKGNIRLFLTGYGGSCFGEGPYDKLSEDKMGGYAIHAGYDLMMGLLKKAEKNRK